MKKIAMFLPLVLLAGTACWPFSSDDEISEMSLQRLAGRVTVVRAGEPPISVEDSFDLEPGDVIQTAREGRVELRLKGERKGFMLGDAEATVVDTKTIEAGAGDLLANAGEAMTVRFGNVEAVAESALFRIDQGFGSARAATYRGVVQLVAPGQARLDVPQLFQASVSANQLPGQARPYGLDKDDPWDQQYLEALVELEDQLEVLGAGLSSQLRNQRPSLAYFSTLAGDKDVGFLKGYRRRSIPNLLIGFSVADNARAWTRSHPGGLGAAFKAAFSFYDAFEAGGHWGVVAGIMNVSAKPLVAQVEGIATSFVAVAAGGGAEETNPFTLAAAESAGSPGAPPIDSPPDEPPGNGGGGDDPPEPKPSESPKPADECESSFECAVEDIIDPSPSPTPISLLGNG